VNFQSNYLGNIMNENSTNALKQREIINQLQVSTVFNIDNEIKTRIEFIKKQVTVSGRNSLVLGISGGIDSAVAGRLAQLAVSELREEGYSARFIALRLPYGVQLDEHDAQMALQAILPDQCLTVNIKAACDQSLQSILDTEYVFPSESHQDFILGNIKARQRMVVQYALAGTHNGLVIGTDHAAEALMGFFTKFGDGLNKRRIKAIGRHLGFSGILVEKSPTADLESLAPQKLDEDVFGLSYNQIDDFLEGKIVDESVYHTIFMVFAATEHKRQPPAIP
jgi:NAD+ synthase